ncbi:RNA polymerase sigma factor [Paracidobacterium acidisoli]|uniref:Sigma-70 family RNA polymerase sigma factor n=1 Tax=Paracidobacterium acidisoli TaxID=2303751 RepID=A0A372IQ58_9BACT|nr:sigma-70 family RNA polymerase sigma factor [Paracidobacterium acidisoli]MBT9330977.1 sigma-70 family RNA polymerase sigma factor [Paracidobacterium acidisoli]
MYGIESTQEVILFEFEKQFPAEATSKIVATQGAKRSLEQRQRDIYESHRHRVFSLAFYMTGNEIEAESILTETFVAAFQTDPEPDCGMVDRALMERLRERYSLSDGQSWAMPAISDEGVSRNVRRTELEEAIQELPDTERLIFLLRDVECYSPSAIAELLKLSETNVRRALMAARIRLRQQLATAPMPCREAA